MLAKSSGGANGGVFTQVMEGGMAGSHNAGSAALASSEETKRMQAIMMRDRASVALRDKGTLREVVMQTKMVRLQDEFDRTKAKVQMYQGEFRTKALLITAIKSQTLFSMHSGLMRTKKSYLRPCKMHFKLFLMLRHSKRNLREVFRLINIQIAQ